PDDTTVALVALARHEALGLEPVEMPHHRRRVDADAGRELALARARAVDEVDEDLPGREIAAPLAHPRVELGLQDAVRPRDATPEELHRRFHGAQMISTPTVSGATTTPSFRVRRRSGCRARRGARCDTRRADLGAATPSGRGRRRSRPVFRC